MELLYADDLVVIAETENGLIERLNEWKDNMENISWILNWRSDNPVVDADFMGLCESQAWSQFGDQTNANTNVTT